MDELELMETLAPGLLSSSKLLQEKSYTQHGSTTTYDHSVRVACVCLRIASRLKIDVNLTSLVRGALLHDYYLYDWHDRASSRPHHAFKHASYALENARRDFVLNETEEDMIASHMFPLGLRFPKTREGKILCVADKLVSAQETFEGIKQAVLGYLDRR